MKTGRGGHVACGAVSVLVKAGFVFVSVDTYLNKFDTIFLWFLSLVYPLKELVVLRWLKQHFLLSQMDF